MNMFLADVNTLADLKNAVGHGLAIVVILGYLYGVVLFINSCIQDHGSGSWKLALPKVIGIFAATGFCNILFAIFYPGQNILVNWA